MRLEKNQAEPGGYRAAGCLAQVLADLHLGSTLQAAIERSLIRLQQHPDGDEVTRAVVAVLELADRGDPSAERVEHLGAGWVAEEALAIAFYCALASPTFSDGVLLAANHSGDSDSTASITGQLLGVMLGVEAIPKRWKARVDGTALVNEVSIDFARHFVTGLWGSAAGDLERYPDN